MKRPDKKDYLTSNQFTYHEELNKYYEALEKYADHLSLSEREQPVKDGFEDLLKNKIKITADFIDKARENLPFGHPDIFQAATEKRITEEMLSEYRSLSPCKEKWISVERMEMLSKYVLSFENSTNADVYAILDILDLDYTLPSPPTGDNKKGEGNG